MTKNQGPNPGEEIPFEGEALRLHGPLSEAESKEAERQRRDDEYRSRDDAYKGRQTTIAENQLTANRRLVVYTLCLVVVGLIGNVISYLSANAASESARAATDAVQNSVKAFDIDQRPYLVFNGIGFVKDSAPAPNHMVRTDISFKNIGKTPSSHAATYACMIAYPYSEETSFSDDARSKVIDGLFVSAKKQPGFSTKHLGDTAPQDGFFISIPLSDATCPRNGAKDMLGINMTGAEFNLFLKRRVQLLVISGVTYLDQTGKPHETQACRIIRGIDLGIEICEAHNTIR